MKKILDLTKKYRQIISYLFFGGLTTIVNFLTYYIFARLIGVEEVMSSGIAWFCAVLFAYITNKLFVFESKTSTKISFIKEIISFFSCRVLSGILCDIGTFAFMIKVLHINDFISKLITQIMVIILNFILSKFVIFKNNK